MHQFPATELVLNAKNQVYHLGISKEQLAILEVEFCTMCQHRFFISAQEYKLWTDSIERNWLGS